MGSPRREYYEVLGVPRDADPKAIKDAFRRLALRYHPDRCKEHDAEERFKEIAEAYAVLSDPRKRAEYDAGGLAGIGAVSPEDLLGGIDFESLFGGLGFEFGPGRGGLFERLFRGRRAGPLRGENLEVEVEVPLERILTGGEERVSFRRLRECPECGGSGAKKGTSPRPCEECGGSGQRVRRSQHGAVQVQQITTCPSCAGRGQKIDEPCRRCAGAGQVEQEESLAVQIPVGAEEGMALRLPGKGLPSHERGDPPGDLYVVVRTRADRRFVRRGADLWRDEALDLPDAVLGTTLEVPTLDGPVSVRVPPGAQPSSVLRLRAKGLPEFGGGPRGDLYVQLTVRVPERLSREERKLYERLRALAGKASPEA